MSPSTSMWLSAVLRLQTAGRIPTSRRRWRKRRDCRCVGMFRQAWLPRILADISITAASVVASGTGQGRQAGTAGETIAAGKAVYLDPTTHKWQLADSNSATVAARHAGGIAANSASLNQPINVFTSGSIVAGGTLVANTAYYLSDTPGGICPLADVGTGEYMCLLGIAPSTTVLNLDIQFTGTAN